MKIGAAVLLCGVSALAATGLAYVLRPAAPPVSAPARPSATPRLFQGWPKPDLALVLSAEQHGYLLPCGCSRPQLGGLERRYNLIQELRKQGWLVTAVDLGDIPQREGPRKLPNVQGLLKYRHAMESLRDMGYLAVGVGEYEASLSLFEVLAAFALQPGNTSPRVLSANLKDKDTLYPDQVDNALVKMIPGSKLRVGVTSVVGPSVKNRIKDANVQFLDNRRVLPQLATDLKKTADLAVLLYQGSLREGQALARAHPEFHVVLCLSPEDEPRSDPLWAGNTLIAAVGHKGRYVGVVGVYRTGRADKPFELRYQLVSLGEEYLTPDGAVKDHPILARMERYTRELRDGNYLARYGQSKHPSQVAIPGVVPGYVGSKTCQKCHKSAYKVWEGSKHSHAYDALVKATRPSLRQYDAECIVCHTIGFGYEGGYRDEKRTPNLKNVGCESCHGPASEHVKNPHDEKWHTLVNPWKARPGETATDKEQRKLRIDQFCQQCHDIDNDVKYKFEKRWPEVEH
jgi:Cytochrome c554 and c-prime